MIIIIGLVILIAAIVVGLVGVLANTGSAHALTDDFSIFGYHVTGSSGTLFLSGIIIGAIGLAGLSMLLAGARRTARKASEARKELKASRKADQQGPRYEQPRAQTQTQGRHERINIPDNEASRQGADPQGYGNQPADTASSGSGFRDIRDLTDTSSTTARRPHDTHH
ncbi:hypothetical protein [Nocardia callitridis]|uniref:DUF1049 domain-containing protein n=1 Tax=Nocardia callitridis TaxID=648753 RepID=A0ABP9KPK1_9NOCA